VVAGQQLPFKSRNRKLGFAHETGGSPVAGRFILLTETRFPIDFLCRGEWWPSLVFLPRTVEAPLIAVPVWVRERVPFHLVFEAVPNSDHDLVVDLFVDFINRDGVSWVGRQ
jgi:hypothetical protein